MSVKTLVAQDSRLDEALRRAQIEPVLVASFPFWHWLTLRWKLIPRQELAL